MIKTEIISVMAIAAIVIPSALAFEPTTGSLDIFINPTVDLEDKKADRTVFAYVDVENYDLENSDGLTLTIVDTETGLKAFENTRFMVASSNPGPYIDFVTLVVLPILIPDDELLYADDDYTMIVPGNYEFTLSTGEGHFIGSDTFTVTDSR